MVLFVVSLMLNSRAYGITEIVLIMFIGPTRPVSGVIYCPSSCLTGTLAFYSSTFPSLSLLSFPCVLLRYSCILQVTLHVLSMCLFT